MDRLCILILDHSTTIRNGLKALLEPLNAEILDASNGRDGLDLVSKHVVHLIITSIDMPEMSGIDFCRHIRGLPAMHDVPVVVLSSFSSDADIEKAFEAGASAYIAKREARTRLYGTVEELITRSFSQSQKTIMVVDDSLSIRNMIKKTLMEAGFQVVTAENGKDALRRIAESAPDLVLSDVNMPEMNGFDLCEALHGDPELATIPFVAMSSLKDRDQMRRIIKYGATDYMVKPFSMDQLVIHIERFLTDHLTLLLKDKERLDSERQMLLGAIASLLTMLEIRAPYVREHTEAVAHITAGMATLMGASKREIELVRLGSRLHDIGKISFGDSLIFNLRAPGERDLTLIHKHPELGVRILKSLPHISDEMLDIVLSHHERPDGKGYPHGLKESDISPWAAITAVADTYHTLISSSSYHSGMTLDNALQYLEDIRGTELCADYVDLFFRWVTMQDGKGLPS